MTTTIMPVVTGILGREFRYAREPGEVAELVEAIINEAPIQFAQVYVWDRPCRQSHDGSVHEFPRGRLRITAYRDRGWGALNYMHPGAPDGRLVDSYNPDAPNHAPALIFDPEGADFPPSASLPLDQVREAVAEYARTGARPTCVQWQPGYWY
ncbi:Imm1 family immunity protein [Saccharopolyspora cebuensis]|uniref:Imm1 family immunity protein n=1 Tax=Saccharopolyspora cebuensis TaxID=418759 RepID=A0ABV4CJH4_9PSEU